MAELRKPTTTDDNNFFESLWFRFFPYWPLMVALAILFLVPTFLYLLHKNPKYTVGASLVINTEAGNTGSNYSNQPFKALNAYAMAQNVDNEVLVLQSRSLMQKVVTRLHLYAPVVEKGHLTKSSAYTYAPVYVEAQHPDVIHKKENIFFDFDAANNTVRIDSKTFPLNQWIPFQYGTIRFIRNPNSVETTNKQFYFSLYNPTSVAEALLPNLKVNSANKLATVVNITYQTEVPEEGADIVNELIREYTRQSVDNENSMASNTLTFVDERLRDVEHDLDSIERRIQQFRSQQGVIDLSEQGHLYLQNVSENNRQLAEVNTQLSVLDQVERYVNSPNNRTGIVPTTLGIDDPVLAQLLQRLNELELQLSNLRATTGANNPMVLAIENEINKIRPNIRGIVNNQRARLTASRNNLVATTSGYNKSIQNIPKQERELLEISRQQAVKRDLYSFLLQRREEAAMSTASNIADNRVIDWADPRTAKVTSKKMIYLLGSLIAALALTIFYVIYRESLTSKVLFRSTIESLTTIPVLGEVVYAGKNTRPLPNNDTALLRSKQFQQLQAALGLFTEAGQKQKILVTSSIADEGKSFISSHFAASLAAAGKRVVLVDANLYHPEIASLFEVEQSGGMKEYLQGSLGLNAIVRKTGEKNLDLVTAGGPTDQSLSLLSDSKLRELFDYLQPHYDYLIIDSPPVELATDAYLLSAFCDVTLFIIRYGVTPKVIVRKMDANPRLNQIPNSQIVFNGIKGRGLLKKYYGFGFGYGKEQVYKNKSYKNAG